MCIVLRPLIYYVHKLKPTKSYDFFEETKYKKSLKFTGYFSEFPILSWNISSLSALAGVSHEVIHYKLINLVGDLTDKTTVYPVKF